MMIGIIRLLKLALKAGRECVGMYTTALCETGLLEALKDTVQKQLPLALRIMEKAARYHEEIEKMHGDQSNEEKATFQRSSVQFYTLRMTIVYNTLTTTLCSF